MMSVGSLLLALRKAGVNLKLDGDKLKVVLPKSGLDAGLKAQLIERKEEVKAYISAADKGNQKAQQDDIVPRRDKQVLAPSSFAQQRLWLIDKFENGSSHYNTYAAFEFVGTLAIEQFQKAFVTIVQRHESLRTVFVENDQGLFQQVRPFDAADAGAVVEVLPEVSSEEALNEAIHSQIKQPFDLASDYMLRVAVIPCGAERHVMTFVTHHIASDGWSLAVIAMEMNELYRAGVEGRQPQLPEIDVQYADFAIWQQQQWREHTNDSDMDYWLETLQGANQSHQLPLDFPRPSKQSFVGRRFDFELNKELGKNLSELTTNHKVTLFSVMETAFALLIARLSDQNDLVIGVPVAGRDNQQLEPLIGFFVNTLALRSHIDWQWTFAEFLQQNEKAISGALAHQSMPFDQLIERLDIERSQSQSPLFQILFAFQNNRPAVIDLPELAVSDMKVDGQTAKFDLELHVTEHDDGMSCSFYFNTALFSQQSVKTFAESFELLLQEVCENQETPVAQLRLSNAASSTLPPEPKWPSTTAHQMIERQCELTPEKVAVVFARHSLSYRALNQQANQLANLLINHALAHNSGGKVAIYLPRSMEMVVAIVAVLKSGCAYLPIDTDLPANRIESILADAGDIKVISNREQFEQLNLAKEQAVLLDDEATKSRIAAQSLANPVVDVRGEDLAYVLYTSGSTGKPKSIGMPHKALVNLIEAMKNHQPRLAQSHNAIQFASVGFDMSFTDIFLTLQGGGKLVMLAPSSQYDVAGLTALMAEHQISLLNLPYSMLHAIAEQALLKGLHFGDLQVIISTAEALKITDEIRQFFVNHPHCRLVNHYGPSETHVITALNLDGDALKWPAIPSIGEALDNVHWVVLDSRGQLVAPGMPGLLYIGGVCLARGYLNRADLTAEKFVDLAFAGEKPQRYYNTGDLVRAGSDGNFHYLGRVDKQLKLRGFRIEPGEVEKLICTHQAVSTAVVTLDNSLGFEQLVAYVQLKQSDTSQSDKNAILKALKQSFAQNLPGYMVPSAVQFSDIWPLNVNGKVDISGFAPIEYGGTETFVAAKGQTQLKIAAIWARLLNRDAEDISAEEDFFTAGGNSLLLTRMLNEVAGEFDSVIAVDKVINNCTVCAIEQQLNDEEQHKRIKIEKQGKTRDVAVSFNQQRMLLLDQMPGGNALYNMPITLELNGQLNTKALQRAFEQVIERHEILRTRYEFTGGFGLQQVCPSAEFVMKAHDLSSMAEQAREDAVASVIAQGSCRPFDLSEGQMVRADLIRLAETRNLLLVVFHHIAFDGWSNAILVNELRHFYQSNLETGHSESLPQLPIQYSDFALWQQQNWLTEDNASQDYWLETLADLPAVNSLPLSRPRDVTTTGQNAGQESAKFDSCSFTLDEKALKSIDTLTKQHKVSHFVVMYAAFSYLLSHWGQNEDTVVGTPVAGRDAPELENLLGFFINTVVLRNRVDGNLSIAQLIEQTGNVANNAFKHQSMPFELLLEKLNPARSKHHSPLFQIWFVMQNNAKADLALPSLDIEVLPQPLPGKYELNVYIEENEQGMEVRWLFDSQLYNKETIEYVGQNYCRLLALMAEYQSRSLAELTGQLWQMPQTGEESVFNDKAFETPVVDGDIYARFSMLAESCPQAIALESDSGNTSYGELKAQIDEVAAKLQGFNGASIGLMLGQSEDMIVAMMAALKAGICYVPLDAALPAERLTYIIEDADIGLVLSNTETRDAAAKLESFSVVQDITQLAPSNLPNGAIKASIEAAYILYTSGTTGQPKGVKQSAANLHYFAELYRQKCQMSAEDKVSLLSAFGFDSAVMDTFAALLCGATLQIFDIQSLQAAQLAERGTTIVHCTPTLYRFVFADIDCRLENVRLVIMGGEPVVTEDLSLFESAFSTNCQFINGYGLSESTMALQWWPTRQDVASRAQPNLGYPVTHNAVSIRNSEGTVAKVFEHGQIIIGHPQVALAYHKQPELSEKVFQRCADGRAQFETGDWGFYLPDGQIRFVGRRDLQVKLNGVRIELAEIEGRLRAIEGIEMAAVVLVDVNGTEQLCAFLQSSKLQRPGASELSALLLNLLPAYMVPTHYLWLDEMPLTHSGKVQRKQLPLALIAQQNQYVPAKTESEKALVVIWQELFKGKTIGIEDGFHQLGGHSLQVMRMLAQIREQFNLELTFTDVVEAVNIKRLAALIDETLRVKRLKSSGTKSRSLSI